MKAVMFTAPGVMEMQDVSVPLPAVDELLIRIGSVGICGSDVEGYVGKTGRRLPPMIMGHELAGEVAQTPSGSQFAVGQRVTIHPKFFCGQCSLCQAGRTNLCPHARFLGVMSHHGGLAEYAAVPERFALPVSPELPWEHACMVEPTAVAYHAVHCVPLDRLRSAAKVLVVGAGPIGLLVLQILRQLGVDNIIVTDLQPLRRQLALQLGAAAALDPRQESLPQDAAVCFEAVGMAAAASQSLQVLEIGGTAVWIGNAEKMIQVNMQDIVTRELQIVGSYLFTEADFRRSLQLIEERKIQLDPMITVVTGLEAGPEVFQRLGSGQDPERIKVVLKV